MFGKGWVEIFYGIAFEQNLSQPHHVVYFPQICADFLADYAEEVIS